MLKFDVKIRGIAPLLFNKFPEDGGNSSGPSSKRVPAEEAERSLYRTADGKIYTPSEHLVGAMVKAGTNFKLKGKTTYKDVTKAGVFIYPMQIVHSNQDFVVDTRRVVIQRAGVMKSRARMDEWSLDFQLTCLDPRPDAATLREILTFAGMYVGIGDYRPRYGRFEIVKFEEVK